VNGDGSADVIYYPVSTTYEPADMGDPDGDGVSGPADLADPGYTWIFKTVLNPADPAHPTTSLFFDPLSSIGDRPEVYFAATASWLPDGSLGIYWGTGGPDNRDASKPGYFFAVEDPDPTNTGEGVPIENFGENGVMVLGNGENLTWEPVIDAGTLYFVTYSPDCGTCTTGTSRIYGLRYDTAADGMDTDGDGTADAPYYQVDAPVGSIKISDQGLLFYGTSEARADGTGTIQVGTLSLVSSPAARSQTMAWGERI
jgi:hypothetical protein